MKRRRRTRRGPSGSVLAVLLLVLVGSLLATEQRLKDAGIRLPGFLESGVGWVHKATSHKGDHVYKIMLDPGHGGKDPGSAGFSGKSEKDSNLSLALKVYELLASDSRFDPRLTRTDDTFVELGERAAMANDWHADALVSIHGNAYEDKATVGTETYYRYENSKSLAEAIHHQVVAAMGFPDRGVKEERLKVLSLSKMPAILLETGYLSNPGEEAVMLGEEGQALAAKAIVDGLISYFAVDRG